MSSYIITFYTHYGALKFFKKCQSLSLNSKLMPVPRKLSASCGTCVWFEADSTGFISDGGLPEDLEKSYAVTGKDEYAQVKIQI